MAEENLEEQTEEQQTEENNPDEGLTDKHGQEAISKGKYERDIAERDKRIAELQAKIDEAAATEKGRADLSAEIEKLKQEMADKDTAHKLENAGCLNVKAAKALLDDYESIDKLKEECPYLFKQEKKGATGGKPAGAPNPADEMLERMRSIAGVKKKE